MNGFDRSDTVFQLAQPILGVFAIDSQRFHLRLDRVHPRQDIGQCPGIARRRSKCCRGITRGDFRNKRLARAVGKHFALQCAHLALDPTQPRFGRLGARALRMGCHRHHGRHNQRNQDQREQTLQQSIAGGQDIDIRRD